MLLHNNKKKRFFFSEWAIFLPTPMCLQGGLTKSSVFFSPKVQWLAFQAYPFSIHPLVTIETSIQCSRQLDVSLFKQRCSEPSSVDRGTFAIFSLHVSLQQVWRSSSNTPQCTLLVQEPETSHLLSFLYILPQTLVQSLHYRVYHHFLDSDTALLEWMSM